MQNSGESSWPGGVLLRMQDFALNKPKLGQEWSTPHAATAITFLRFPTEKRRNVRKPLSTVQSVVTEMSKTGIG